MSKYLQDPLNDQTFELLTNWLAVDKGRKDINYWIIGDGAFAPHLLTPRGALDWRAVFTFEPMKQYEEMGLFIAPMPIDPLMLQITAQALKLYNGLPMFSIIATKHSEEELKAFLTWLSDAYTDDGLSVYQRIGDTRCLPAILKNLEAEQNQVLGGIMHRWTWFERDGILKHRFVSNQSTLSSMVAQIMQKPFVISERQYISLIESGEIDLIYASIQDADELFINLGYLSERYKKLSIYIRELKKQGITDLNELKDRTVREISRVYDKRKNLNNN